MKILDLAYYTINNFSNMSNNGISPMKLQKLLYYTKVWGIVAGNDIVEGEFEHWDYGPVNYSVYQKFKHYGSNPIQPINTINVEPIPEEKDYFDFVLHCYIPFSAIELSKMTHVEKPWKKTPKNQIITPEKIYNYFSKKKFAKNFPLEANKPFYPVETDSHYAFIFDMNESTQEELYYNSFQEYLDTKAKSENSADINQLIDDLNTLIQDLESDI